MAESKKKKQINICPPDWLYKIIEEKAIKDKRSKAYIVEEILETLYKDKAGK